MKKYYGITSFLIFGVFSILTVFYYPYLNQEIGLDLIDVSRIVSIGAISTLISQPIIANRFSKSSNKNRFIVVYLLIVSICIVGLMFINKDYSILFAPIYGAFLSSIAGIFEIYIEEICVSSKYEFSEIRKWGSIGYAVIVFIAGIVINNFGYRILHLIALTMVIAMIVLIAFKFKYNVEAIEEVQKANISDLFKNKNIILLIVVIFLGMGSYSGLDFAYSSYLVDVVGDVNRANEIYSTSISFRVIVEFFSFMIISKYFTKANSKVCISVSLIIASIKMLMFSSGNVALIVLGDQLHGVLYALYLSFLFKYLREIVSDNLIATTFTVLAVLSNGGANFIYPSIYTYVQNSYGYFGMYILGFIFIIVSLSIFILFLPKYKSKKAVYLNNF